MTATAEASSGGGGLILLILAGLVAFVLLSGAAAMGALEGDWGNVPAPAINDHAIQGHSAGTLPAEEIYARAQAQDYHCVRVYSAPHNNRMLFLYSYGDHGLEGGIITTTSGVAVTAYAKPAVYWGNVICRDGYVLMAWSGVCPPEMGCK